MPELVKTEAVSYVTPFEAMLIASDCHAVSLIGPATPLITAEALVKVTVPKFGIVAMLPPTVGASTTHSAQLRGARGSAF